MSITVIGKGKTDSVYPEGTQNVLYNKKILSETKILDGTTSVTINDIPQSYDEISIELSDIYSLSGGGELHVIVNSQTAVGTYLWSIFELDGTPAVSFADIGGNGSTSLGNNASAANCIINIRAESQGGAVGNASLTINMPNYSNNVSPKKISCFGKSVAGTNQIRYTDAIYTPKNPIKSVRIESTSSMASGLYTANQKIRVWGITYGS
jgi:hypothetical protein